MAQTYGLAGLITKRTIERGVAAPVSTRARVRLQCPDAAHSRSWMTPPHAISELKCDHVYQLRSKTVRKRVAVQPLSSFITPLECHMVTFGKLIKNALLGMSLVGMLMIQPITAYAASATSVSSEIAAAAIHAGLSAESTTLQVANMHLHHTLNCLVGPSGTGFNSSYFNPCAHLGHGAIPDSGNSRETLKLRHIAEQVRTALKDGQLRTVQKDASRIESELKHMN